MTVFLLFLAILAAVITAVATDGKSQKEEMEIARERAEVERFANASVQRAKAPEVQKLVEERRRPSLEIEEPRPEPKEEQKPEEAEAQFPDSPLSESQSEAMQKACDTYGCPYELALAVAQVESNFNANAVGSSGEVGMMQLLPGPGGAYHKEIQRKCGMDPRTESGNIGCGCYMLADYLAKYQDVAKVAMAYNMGEGGAQRAWRNGVVRTGYSDKILQALSEWTAKTSGEVVIEK